MHNPNPNPNPPGRYDWVHSAASPSAASAVALCIEISGLALLRVLLLDVALAFEAEAIEVSSARQGVVDFRLPTTLFSLSSPTQWSVGAPPTLASFAPCLYADTSLRSSRFSFISSMFSSSRHCISEETVSALVPS